MVVVAVLIVELRLVPGLVVVKLQVPKLMMVGLPVIIVKKGPAYQEDDIYSVMSTYTYIPVINCLYNLF